MKNYIKHHEWLITEEGFDPKVNRVSESIFSIGNGKFGHRANFEESYSGDSLSGNYVAGVYYPDKTRVGWWKNGYPEYFAKVLNAPNWAGLKITINGESIDLAKNKVLSFERVLDMQHGLYIRQYQVALKNGITVTAEIIRFCNLDKSNNACFQYKIKTSEKATIKIKSFMDGKVRNQDSNYGERFWIGQKTHNSENESKLIASTKKTDFWVGFKTDTHIIFANKRFQPVKNKNTANATILNYEFEAEANKDIIIEKRAVILSSLDYEKTVINDALNDHLDELKTLTFDEIKKNHQNSWLKKWEESDIIIEGDVAAQQAIRFNIFQLNSTYTGEDERLNIGPKGFTGEKYGGSTYWDTEAYCLPFYQATAEPSVARNLLIYRYKHLQKAIENAALLGFNQGAALYPMVTMNGEECHNEWEITFEEIHRNGAIAYAIYDYIKYTGDQEYIKDYGADVLIGIARFWAQRVNWSEDKQQYVMLGVTGPNEFENNVNNNWYTNKIATWCMSYAIESLEWVKENHTEAYHRITNTVKFEEGELMLWQKIIQNMYYPYSEKHQVYLQQDGFLDKELIPVSELPNNQRPIVEHWSWDRILRSCYIKQADVLQGFYFFEDEFDIESHRRHYDFYEPLTVHESSLSPCIHSILASKLGDEKRAYEFYLRTARLDLDDYNNDTRDGLHITSMAGTWLSIVKGFAGMRVKDGNLTFRPFLPENWTRFAFKIRFRDEIKTVSIDKNGLLIV